ncbi:putative bifunctional diguanylate cyclase/phosphodiesterase [Kineococcus esterisolvens]|uniref:putative bifunctional diguanylate cyclase/phosphodiesterase n=1 Tax=unclassified Kineococcus TaxID=2621656 RepID=UPI003D7C62FA
MHRHPSSSTAPAVPPEPVGTLLTAPAEPAAAPAPARRPRAGRSPAGLPAPVPTALVLVVCASLVLTPPWRATPPALALAAAVAVVTWIAPRAGAPGAAASRRAALRRFATRVPPWCLTATLTAVSPFPLAVAARCLPLLHRGLRHGHPRERVVADLVTAAVGVLTCRLVTCALTATSPLAGVVVLDVRQWPVVLAGASAGLLAEALVASAVGVPGAAARPGRQPARDEVTGLPGREVLLEVAERALGAAGAPGPAGPGAPGLLLVDLDRFRDVNDALGHRAGDEVLHRVAGRLLALAPPGAVVARLGGDEFAVLVADGGCAEDLARRVVARAAQPLHVGGLQVLLPASVGVALAPEHGRSASALLRAAEAALYEAKEVRGRACTYAGERGDGVERLRLQGELARAVQRGELFVQYQPQADPATGALVGAEALVRWRHPELGTVAPDRFVPLAERSDLVRDLTRVVLERALADVAGWRACGCDVTVSVNLSARSLADADLAGLVAEALQRHGVPARTLVLEITETGLVSHPERAGAVVRALRALGCSVAVDDYGTGHSSLCHLTDLAVDELKIDRSFVTAMTTDRTRAVIVRSTVQMARDLGLRVVAEGVEDAGTLRALAAMGCHVVQGTHVGVPVAPGEVLWLLATRGAAGGPHAASRLVATRRAAGTG